MPRHEQDISKGRPSRLGAPFLPQSALPGPNQTAGQKGAAWPIFLILGILANAMGLFGAGDAKFIAAAAPFVWAADARLVGLIFMANLLAAYLAHRMAKHTALRALAPDWASWDAGAKFPMGLPLATSLMIYLAIASL